MSKGYDLSLNTNMFGDNEAMKMIAKIWLDDVKLPHDFVNGWIRDCEYVCAEGNPPKELPAHLKELIALQLVIQNSLAVCDVDKRSFSIHACVVAAYWLGEQNAKRETAP